ncbi:DNA-dependent_ATPase [Hexamita inflata]|uniref:Putative n=1 Tax=Hexamita inflata TaxID=28002 RepID=A0AA86QIN3_9EUKA|nr:DNA-dependent ATPase [Hexamita inflata]
MSTLLEKVDEMKRICGIYDDDIGTDGESTTGFNESTTLRRVADDAITEVSESVTTTAKRNQQYQSINIKEQPKNLTGGTLKYYQMDSLVWMMNVHRMSTIYNQHFRDQNVKNPYNYQINAILADQMGLGKTIQTLALLCQVYESFGIRGKHLIIVPKSTIPQWQQEQVKWCPMFRMLTVIGEKEEREKQLAALYSNKYDIVLSTYDIVRIEANQFVKHEWSYLIMDEGHKLKDTESIISQIIASFKCDHKLLLTGTPIQNDLHELWSLLTCLMPYLFSSAEEFVQVVTNDTVKILQKILKIFLLRREKEEVESLPPKTEYLIHCPMTSLQKKIYRGVLTKDLDSLQVAIKSKSNDFGKTSLLNILMQLRKVADHPYLFKGIEPEPYRDGDHLINVSGKMVVMHQLIQKIQSRGEKVLIFCQMTNLLNLIADYLHYKQIPYVRIDGSTELDERSAYMKHFMKEDSHLTVFLLSTRAGCLGLNLTAANHVIVFQQDFNPQVDQQAVARAYRILQKKPVYVYRLLSENSVDIKIYERACVKMELDQLIIQSGNFSGKSIERDLTKTMQKGGLLDLISFKTDELFKDLKIGEKEELPDYEQPEVQFSQEKIDQLLNEAEIFQKQAYDKAQEEKVKAQSVITKLNNEGKLDGFDTRELYTFEGENYGKDSLKKLAQEIVDKRQANYQSAQKFKMVVEEEEKDRRLYPTQQRFRKSDLFRPDFYLLSEEFYKLQDKVIREIVRQIEPVFIKDQQITYDEYLEMVRQTASLQKVYINPQLPGLTEEECKVYDRYLVVNCPHMNNKEVSKKDFINVMTSLTEYDPTMYPEYLGIRKIQLSDINDQKAVENPVMGDNLFPYEMLNPKIHGVCTSKDLDTTGKENFEIAYMFYQKTFKGQISEEDFTIYGQALIQNLERLDDGIKIKQRFEKAQFRRHQFMLKVFTLRRYIEKFDNPLVEMKIPQFQQQRKTYSTLEDRYLLLLTDQFGYGKWNEIVTFILWCPSQL